MKKIIITALLLVISFNFILPQENNNDTLVVSDDLSWAQRMGNSFMYRNQDYYITYGDRKNWNYEQGLMLEALYQLYLKTDEEKYLDFMKNNLEHYIEEDGEIKDYELNKYRLDDITPGKALLYLYKITGKEKYKKAADTLMKHIKNQPRTESGGFWHKEIYPHQMWLDGLYMAEPFYAQYAKMFDHPSYYDDIAKQFILIYNKTKDPETGLLYHGWDESKNQKWADPETGLSSHFWGRAVGWYLMGIVDVLDFFPEDHPDRKELINILQQVSESLLKYRDKEKDVWYQILDKGDTTGNYLEASASCMYVYSFAKGANKDYLDKRFLEAAQKSYKGILEEFIEVEENGLVNLHHVCSGAGLGGNPYRDGSYEYYISEPQRTNDFKGIGPFILASIELNR